MDFAARHGLAHPAQHHRHGRNLSQRQPAELLNKIAAAIRMLPAAMYAVYFDIVRKDPERLAEAARAGIREACFATGSHHRLPLIDLSDWLCGFRSSLGTVVLPMELPTEGVGNASYFHALAAICAASRPTRIVEFGTFLGLGTAVLALNSAAGILTIDLPDTPRAQETETLSQADLTLVSRSRNRIGAYYRGETYADRITEVRCDSRRLDLRDYVPFADLCLIDGGHSYECIASDTSNALRVLAPGGTIIWDDYFWMYPDVVLFLNELQKAGYPLYRIKGTNLVVYRNSGSRPAPDRSACRGERAQGLRSPEGERDRPDAP